MSLRQLMLKSHYRTAGDANPIWDFYNPCLQRATVYLRAAGYFRSSILRLTGETFVEFAKRGGKAHLVCSPDLTPADLEAIQKGEATTEKTIEKRLLEDVQELIDRPDLERNTAILATLIAHGALSIIIAYRPSHAGIFHEKLGCFVHDDEATVSFIGSANETLSAWAESGNYESLEVFCSWRSADDKERTQRHESYLRDLIANRISGVSTVAFPEAVRLKLIDRAYASIEEIDLNTSRQHTPSQGRKPLPHQQIAIDNWKRASHRGVLKHATGSGKTFTAILAISEHVSAGQPALVTVPSKLLLAQWTREIEAALPDAVIVHAGDGHSRWKERSVLRAHSSPSAGYPRVTLSTMATASGQEFLAKYCWGDHVLFVCDEVHQVGSTENSRILSKNTGKRLGLSATPERFGDPAGTAKIFDYFGQILEPIVTLKDAISAGRLVQYEYHPHGIVLNEIEAEEWRQITRRIGFILSAQKASSYGGLSEEAKQLLIRRSRIAKKASQKLTTALNILKDSYKESDRWLVYCEDVDHMNDLADLLRGEGILPSLFYSSMQECRDETLKQFDQRGGVVLAVRCLDEGVDIPSISHAMIVASSQNPRQFIQRRGRILRQAVGKSIAVLHDLVVLPVGGENDPMNSLESEFVRAIQFANDAINHSAHAKLIHLAVAAGIDIRKHYAEFDGENDD